MNHKKKFTLLELLFVIVVILILMSFLVPAIQGFQKKAREIDCKSRLRQLGVLITVYTQDNNGKLPGSVQTDLSGNAYLYGGFASNTVMWFGHLAPYLIQMDNWNQAISSEPFKSYVLDFKEGNSRINELSVFLCPEAMQTPDAHSLQKFPDENAPRVNITGQSGQFAHSYMGTYPYFGDTDLFGGEFNQSNVKDSHFIRDIKDQESMPLIVEGMNPQGRFAQAKDSTWYKINTGASRRDMTKNVSAGQPYFSYLNNFSFSFMHDDIEEFWVSEILYAGWVSGDRAMQGLIDQLDFTKAMPFQYNDTHRVSLMAFDDPNNNGNFNGNYNGLDLTFDFLPAKYFYEEEYRYMAGNMNVLFTDMHVSKKSDFWLSYNCESILNNYNNFRNKPQ